MSANSKYSKQDFIRLMLAAIEDDSSSKEKAKEFLSSEGVNTHALISEGLKRIKKMQLEINAEKTTREMESLNDARAKAIAEVDRLLSSIDFSIEEIIEQEELTVSFRNIETLSKDDVRNILIKHFMLKFLQNKK